MAGIRRPDRLANSTLIALLQARQEIPHSLTGLAAGRAAADVLKVMIERLQPSSAAPRAEQLPYLVLHLCFVEGMKATQAAGQLGMSVRNLSRERTSAVRLMQAELSRPVVPAAAETPDYRFMAIPAILDFQPRPQVLAHIQRALTQSQLVHVHGPRGIGKTCLVAELALDSQQLVPVLWYRFRPGVNDTLARVVLELAEHAGNRGRPRQAQEISVATKRGDTALAAGIIVRALVELPLLLILDDYHVVSDNQVIAGFLEDAVSRLEGLRVISLSRHVAAPSPGSVSVEIPPMTRNETNRLLAQLGVRSSPAMADSIRHWTAGVPQLIRLAGTWLRTANDEDVARGLKALSELDAVRGFLLDSISELIQAAERDVLDAASVFRQQYNDEALAYVANLSIGAVQDTSRRLVQSHLATRSRTGTVAFFHTSIREYFYNRLETDRRTQLHSRAAAWYERSGDTSEARFHRHAAAPS